MADERLLATCEGHVQGVGFRWYTQKVARKLYLSGWVRNLPDGRVELLAQGPRPQLERLLEAVRTGPPGARVRRVTFDILQNPIGLVDFTVVD